MLLWGLAAVSGDILSVAIKVFAEFIIQLPILIELLLPSLWDSLISCLVTVYTQVLGLRGKLERFEGATELLAEISVFVVIDISFVVSICV